MSKRDGKINRCTQAVICKVTAAKFSAHNHTIVLLDLPHWLSALTLSFIPNLSITSISSIFVRTFRTSSLGRMRRRPAKPPRITRIGMPRILMRRRHPIRMVMHMMVHIKMWRGRSSRAGLGRRIGTLILWRIIIMMRRPVHRRVVGIQWIARRWVRRHACWWVVGWRSHRRRGSKRVSVGWYS